MFRIISIPFYYFHPPDHMILMAIQALDFRCQCTQHKLQSICAVLTFDPQLSKNLNIFCKRQISIKLSYLYQKYEYRDNYFFKIKFVFFLYLLLSVSWNENGLPLYISDIRHILGYRTSVCIQPFPWCLHITITYNLTHLRLWNAGSRLPRSSDIKTQKARNVVELTWFETIVLGIGDRSRFWLHFFRSFWLSWSQKMIKWFSFQFFDDEHTWRRLFQKYVLLAILDI